MDYISTKFKGDDFGIAYIYCNFKDESTQNPIRIFESILRQLGGQKKRIFPGIKALYEDLSRTSRRPTLSELFKVLKTVIKGFSRVWLFFDALDECLESSRATALSGLEDLRMPNVQVFATSRPHLGDIESVFKEAMILEVSASTQDIGTFIRSKINKNPRVRDILDMGSIDLITQKIIEKSDGMYVRQGFNYIPHSQLTD